MSNLKKIDFKLSNAPILLQENPKGGVYEYGQQEIITHLREDFRAIHQSKGQKTLVMWLSMANNKGVPIGFWRSSASRLLAAQIIRYAPKNSQIQLGYDEYFRYYEYKKIQVKETFSDRLEDFLQLLAQNRNGALTSFNEVAVQALSRQQIILLQKNILPRDVDGRSLVVSAAYCTIENQITGQMQRLHPKYPNEVYLQCLVNGMAKH